MSTVVATVALQDVHDVVDVVTHGGEVEVAWTTWVNEVHVCVRTRKTGRRRNVLASVVIGKAEQDLATGILQGRDRADAIAAVIALIALQHVDILFNSCARPAHVAVAEAAGRPRLVRTHGRSAVQGGEGDHHQGAGKKCYNMST